MDISRFEPFIQTPSYWVSGRYIFREGDIICPVFVVATATPEVFEVTYYTYSYWPLLTKPSFGPFKKAVWPVGAAEIFVFEVEGADGLTPSENLLPDDLEDRAWDADWESPETVADLLCPYMPPLEEYDPLTHELNEGFVGDIEACFEDWATFEDQDTPDFWAVLK